MSIYDDLEDLYPEDGQKPQRAERDIEASRQYASAVGPDTAPEGTVWVPELGTYVDAEVAAQVARDDPGLIYEDDDYSYEPVPEAFEASREDTEDYQNPNDEGDEQEDDGESPQSNSETLDEMESAAPRETVATINNDIIEGNFDAVLNGVSQTLGVDAQAASSLIEMTVEEARPTVEHEIGAEAFSCLVYAATKTPDPMARRVLNDMVRGGIPKGRMTSAYNLWYQSLPDAD